MSAGSADDQRSARYWRMLEAEARILASAMTDRELRRVLLSIAEAYKRLAERAELREPRPLIENASFGPKILQAIGEAFEVGWLEIADHYSNTQAERETARVKLATALLSVATEDTCDPQVLKTAALVRMKASYRYL